MKLKLKNTPEQVELIRALGSKDQTVAGEAQDAFAAFIGPVIGRVLQQAATSTAIFSDSVYDEDDNPSYPLDLYYDEGVGYITVWSQSIAGGMPTSQVEGVAEMKISTYRIDSAISWMKKYARKSRLDIVSKALERMAQEILVKQERNAWAVIMKALAEARTPLAGGMSDTHMMEAGGTGNSAENRLRIVDLSRLMTLLRRLNASWAGGTAVADVWGLTDLFVSPEVKEDVRNFAFEPVNTLTGPGTGGVIALPEGARADIYRQAGANELFGVRITDLQELGVGRKYNKLFEQFASGLDIVGGNSFQDTSSVHHEILIGVDASRESFIRPVARQHDSGGTFTVLADDQFNVRADKVGFYGFLEEGRICIDSKAIVGLTLNRG